MTETYISASLDLGILSIGLSHAIENQNDLAQIQQIRADNWSIFDWADQSNPADPPKITDPPKILYQPININILPPPEIPERRLPKEEDGQTEFKTVGSSVSVKASIKNRKFGQLLWNPVKRGKQKLRFSYNPDLTKKLQETHQKSLKDYQTWFEAQIIPERWIDKEYKQLNNKISAGCALLRPEELKGHQGKIKFSYGVDWINTIAQSYYLGSLNASMQVRDFIYEKTEIKQQNIPKKDSKVDTDKRLELVSDAALFFRQGLHRYPATLPAFLLNLTKDEKEPNKQPEKEPVEIISDTVSFMEWFAKNLDALFGEFPIKIKYKNAEGEEKTLEVDNLAESLAELIGIAINIAADTDICTQLGFKNLVESTKAANCAIVAGDYARANADYLGYKGREVNRKVKLTYTPGKETFTESLTESESNIVGFTMDDKETLQDQLSKTLIILQILKSAFYYPWKPGDPLTGDGIAEQRKKDKEKADKKWEDLLNDLNNPNGLRKINGNPIPKIRDVSTGEKQ